MAENTTLVQAPPEDVFDTLLDPASYLLWVVGSKHVRGVDAQWPQVGARLHHVVGWGPLNDHDVTEILAVDRPRRLVLEARAWPFGTAEVEITVVPEANGTRLTLRETPRQGPAARFDNRLMQLGIRLRNRLGLRRLCRWVEERYRAAPGRMPST